MVLDEDLAAWDRRGMQVHVEAAVIARVELLHQQRRSGVLRGHDQELGARDVERGDERVRGGRIGGGDAVELRGFEHLRELLGAGRGLGFLCGGQDGEARRGSGGGQDGTDDNAPRELHGADPRKWTVEVHL